MSFWLIYIFFSLIISFLISKFFNKKFLKILFFSFTLAVLLSIWFKEPGSTNFAPIMSIFILESSILESHGLMRILRPLSLSIFFALIFSGIYWFFRSKNWKPLVLNFLYPNLSIQLDFSLLKIPHTLQD